MRLDFHPCREHFNSREILDAYKENQLHLICPACLGKANYMIALSLDHPDKTKELRARGASLGEEANQTRKFVTLLPDLPVSALPMNPNYADPDEPAELTDDELQQAILSAIETHAAWILKRAESGERMFEFPGMFFNLDQDNAFPVERAATFLEQIADSEGAKVLADLEQSLNTLELRILRPIIECRVATMM